MTAIDAAFFDRRGYPTISARAGYDEWADTYEATVATGLDELLLPRLASIEWQQIDAVADLACGTGRTGLWLKSRGVGAIDGVDVSAEMLARAEKKSVYRHLKLGEISEAPLPSGIYQLCTMSLADEHLPDLASAYRTATRLLRSGGQFLLLGYHPFFLMNGLLTHFHRPNGEAVTIQSYVPCSVNISTLATRQACPCQNSRSASSTKPGSQPSLNGGNISAGRPALP